MTKNNLSPLAADLIEALNEVYDDVTGRKRLLRYPRRLRITEDLSGSITIDNKDDTVTSLRPDRSTFVRCIVQ
jgi:hypothetical protein